MIVTQTGDRLSLETKLISEQSENVVFDSYVPEGKEMDFAPRTSGGETGKGKRIDASRNGSL